MAQNETITCDIPAAAAQSSPIAPHASSPPDSTFISGLIGDNPYFQAGFGLMGLGVVLTGARQALVIGSIALRRRLLVSLEINNKDKAYDWFLAWMANQTSATSAPVTSQKSTLLSRSAPWSRSHQLSVETTFEQRKNGNSSVLFKLVAGPGVHWLRYQGAWMQVKRERETRSMQIMSGIPWETVTLTTLSKDRKLFPQLLSEARELAMREQEGKLIIFTAWGTEWRPFGQPRRKRPLRSVVLEHGVAEKIEQDVRSFLDRRQWYADRGIPYRRGYLLHGPPGSGKSSFIQALAGSLGYDICLLNLSERGLADDKLIHLLSNAPERSIVLMEDVDAAFNRRVQTSEDGYQSSVTFSGFLNALDGVASGEERIIFLTTNHADRLDPALIRPGRVDLSMLIDDASPLQAKRLFTRFYGGEDYERLESLACQLEDVVDLEMKARRRVSMATLQGIFIRNGPVEAVQECKDLFVTR